MEKEIVVFPEDSFCVYSDEKGNTIIKIKGKKTIEEMYKVLEKTKTLELNISEIPKSSKIPYGIVNVTAIFAKNNIYESSMDNFADTIIDYIGTDIDIIKVEIIDEGTLQLLLKNKSDIKVVIDLLNDVFINSVDLKAYRTTSNF